MSIALLMRIEVLEKKLEALEQRLLERDGVGAVVQPPRRRGRPRKGE
ncbi:MAG: hypothetical protein QOK29_2976 [Rhodospirillaceae bacterium]|jgi:hypothetical protein|nr:hypothetical protein [Rhodospirillaceae bacterium]